MYYVHSFYEELDQPHKISSLINNFIADKYKENRLVVIKKMTQTMDDKRICVTIAYKLWDKTWGVYVQ